MVRMMTNHYLPVFENKASCADHDPELWFPQEVRGSRVWTRTPDAMKAREICSECPALMECRNYSLQFSGLYGIWAGKDWYERNDIQKKLGIVPTPMMDTFDSTVFSARVAVDYDE
jgi:WhiB family transcriptional regulator, redox-sensing transcriptional regulator